MQQSRRNLDPGAGFISGGTIGVGRLPSLAALKLSVQPAITPGALANMTLQTTLEPNSTPTAPSGTTRVLILDDEPCISDLLFEMLEMLGYAPSKCSSPVEALAVLQQGEFDVILSDFRMPQMNGDEFYRRAVARDASLRPKFVFLTGDCVSEETHRFLTEQGSRHLSKPFDIASVDQIISEVVAQRSASLHS